MTTYTRNLLANAVCAVIVTYRANLEELAEVIQRARAQTARVTIVDNDTEDDLRESVRDVVSTLNGVAAKGHMGTIELVEMGTNVGLPKAYNSGINRAVSLGCDFVLFLDQDSLLEPNAVVETLRVYNYAFASAKVGAVCCLNVERIRREFVLQAALDRAGMTSNRVRGVKLENSLHHCDGAREVTRFTNSGAMIPVSVFGKVGSFNERLFMDAVDYDFSFRLRDKGFRILQADRARVIHRQGAVLTKKTWSGKELKLQSYGPERSYHIVRDTLEFCRAWYRRFTVETSSVALNALGGTVGALFLLPQKRERFRSVLQAVSDFGNHKSS